MISAHVGTMHSTPTMSKKMLLGGPCYLKLLVNNFVAGSVIGKSGSVISQIEQETGCVMRLSPANSFFPGTQDRIVVISGEQDQINRALLVILGKIRDVATQHMTNDGAGPSKFVAKIVLPKSSVAAIIGKGGQQIKDMQESTRAKIQISNRDDGLGLEERIVTLTGAFECLQSAAISICAILQSDPNLKDIMYLDYSKITGNATTPPFVNPLAGIMGGGMGAYGNGGQYMPPYGGAPYHSHNPHLQGPLQPQHVGGSIGGGAHAGGNDMLCHPCEIVMQIPDMYVGPIIGKNGICLTEIIQSSGARVQISQKGDITPGTSDRKCVISGTVASVHMAHIMILQRKLLAESLKQNSSTHQNNSTSGMSNNHVNQIMHQHPSQSTSSTQNQVCYSSLQGK